LSIRINIIHGNWLAPDLKSLKAFFGGFSNGVPRVTVQVPCLTSTIVNFEQWMSFTAITYPAYMVYHFLWTCVGSAGCIFILVFSTNPYLVIALFVRGFLRRLFAWPVVPMMYRRLGGLRLQEPTRTRLHFTSVTSSSAVSCRLTHTCAHKTNPVHK